ncbi:MAG TPA: type II secretion system protein GspF, partial [Nitrospirae bacterium]|nr:type II secretion system protein GspF [Nitrospirota bacterium]
GATLARATQSYPLIFPDYYTSMVSAGENSGRLPEVLSKLSDFLETQTSVKNKVQNALIYPIFMTGVSIIIISLLFTFVVPKITSLFEKTSASLPMITVILIWVSMVFQKFWWLLLLFAAGAVSFYRWLRKTKQEVIDSILLKLPFGVMQSLYTARFAMTMSFLLSGGIKILKALQLTSKVTGNAVLENRILSARELISQGAKLSASLEGFPPTFLQIISTGEKSGQLAEVLDKACRSYEADFDKKLQRLTSLLEPVLILFMALIVGFIVIAVLLPIFELNQLIR